MSGAEQKVAAGTFLDRSAQFVEFTFTELLALRAGTKTRATWPTLIADASLEGPKFSYPQQLLWVRERWAVIVNREGWSHTIVEARDLWPLPDSPLWQPANEMDKSDSVMTLRIKSTELYLLQKTTPAMAEAEGFQRSETGTTALQQYFDHWNMRHARYGVGVDSTCWVRALTFEVHHCNVLEVPI